MIVIHGFGQTVALIIFGAAVYPLASTIIALVALGGVVVLHWAATKYSLAYPRRVQKGLGFRVNNVRRALLHRFASHQEYQEADLTPAHRVNGKPPSDDAYKIMAVHEFADWKLKAGGLVQNPMPSTLEDLRTFPTKQTQRTLHNLHPGLDFRRRVDGCSLEADRRVGKTAPGGEIRLLPLPAGCGKGRGEL